MRTSIIDDYVYLGEKTPFYNSPSKSKKIRIGKDGKENKEKNFFPNVK